jgi:hypothetical protein
MTTLLFLFIGTVYGQLGRLHDGMKYSRNVVELEFVLVLARGHNTVILVGEEY